MNFSKEQIADLKQTPIASYLSSLGIQPVKEASGQLLYRSPLTDEKSPSFYVHIKKNVFNCFSSGEKGDVIRLVSLLEKTTFGAVLERLASFNPEHTIAYAFGGQSRSTLSATAPTSSKMILLDDQAPFSPTLTNYIMSRAIPMALANQYLQAIRYQNGNNQYQSVGFRTDKGSYALRAKGFKGWLGPGAIRTIPVAGSDDVDVFEGFFDFLSALTYFKLTEPARTTIVLNSTVNLQQALPALAGAQRVNCYFDNDDTGRNATAKLSALHLSVEDCSHVYANFNDFNDMLCAGTA